MATARSRPKKPPKACCSDSPRTLRSATISRPATTAATIAPFSSMPGMNRARMKTVTGTELSNRPFLPPKTSRTALGRQLLLLLRHQLAFSSYSGLNKVAFPPRWVIRPRATSARPGSMPRIRRRPNQTRVTVPGSVVQLGFQGRYAGQRAQHDGLQGPGDADGGPELALLDRLGARGRSLGSQRSAVDGLGVCRQPPHRALEPTRLVLVVGHRLRLRPGSARLGDLRSALLQRQARRRPRLRPPRPPAWHRSAGPAAAGRGPPSGRCPG